MEVSDIMKKMINYSEGNIHDINHLMKVWSYARLIGKLEGLDEKTQRILEVAAITHDIACPLCRAKYGHTEGKLQEKEGQPLVRKFLQDINMRDEEKDRITYLVGHHHTLTDIDGLDYQILIESDYLVNADESCYTKDNINRVLNKIFVTQTGKELLKSIFQL